MWLEGCGWGVYVLLISSLFRFVLVTVADLSYPFCAPLATKQSQQTKSKGINVPINTLRTQPSIHTSRRHTACIFSTPPEYNGEGEVSTNISKP